MNSILRRRRALMGASAKPDNHLVYSLYNKAFSYEYINTEVAPFEADKACTILLDIDITANPTSGDASTPRIIGCSSAFVIGKKTPHTHTIKFK